MKNQFKILAVLGGISAGSACLLLFRAVKWQRETVATVGDLQHAVVAHSEVVSFRDFDGLRRCLEIELRLLAHGFEFTESGVGGGSGAGQ